MSSTPALPTLDADSTCPPVVGWRTWLSWLAVCALFPVMLTIAWTGTNKTILASDPNAAIIRIGLFAVIVAALVAPIYLQCLALRRIVPGLGFWRWFWGLAFAAVVWLGSKFFVERSVLDIDRKFDLATIGWRAKGLLDLPHLLSLPWAQLLFITAALTGAMALLPAVILGRASSRVSRAPLPWYLFFSAAIVGACAAGVVEQLYNLYFYRSRDLNGDSFGMRIEELSLIGGTGAVWGAASATWLCGFVGRQRARAGALADVARPPRVSQMLAGVVLVAMAAPLFRYSIGHDGLAAGFPALRKALSVVPAQDTSQGTPILRFANRVVGAGLRQIAPDGESFISLDAQRMLQQVELATGRRIGSLGEKLGSEEGARFHWSPDGRFLLLRTHGPDWPTRRGRYVEHTNRLRLFSMTARTLTADFSFVEECFESYDPFLMFEGDSQSVWMSCLQSESVPTPNNIMAVRLQLPTLKILAVRRYGELARRGRMLGFAQTQLGTVGWLQDFRDRSTVYFYNLSRDEEVTVLGNLTDPAVMGKLIQQSVGIDDEQIVLRGCGRSSDVSNPAKVGRSRARGYTFCRTMRFDLRTGVLRERRDDANRAASELESSLDVRSQNLRIISTWQASSKAGEIIVRDLTDDRELQRIATRGQTLVGTTRDGRKLVTYDFDGKCLRIYTITR